MRFIFPLQLRSLPLSPWLCVYGENQKLPRAASQFRALTQARRHGGRSLIFPLHLRSLPLSPWLCVYVRTRSVQGQPASFEHSRRHGDTGADAFYLPPPVTLSSSLSVALCLCESQKLPRAASQFRALTEARRHGGRCVLSSPSSYALFVFLRGSGNGLCCALAFFREDRMRAQKTFWLFLIHSKYYQLPAGSFAA